MIVATVTFDIIKLNISIKVLIREELIYYIKEKIYKLNNILI